METTRALTKGEHRLPEAEVLKLRARRAQGESLRALAQAFGYSTEGVRGLLQTSGGDPKPAPEHPAQKLIGQQFGRLTVIGAAKPGPKREHRARCRCDCGREAITSIRSLKYGDTQSCGCLKKIRGQERAQKLTYQGRTQTLQEWCRELKLKRITVYARVNRYGWTVEDSLRTAPYGRYGGHPGHRRKLDPWVAIGIVAEVLMGKNCRQVAERRGIRKGNAESLWHGQSWRWLFAPEETT